MLSNRYFALVDILGFSKMVKHRAIGEIVADIQRLLRISEERDCTLYWTPSGGAKRSDYLKIDRYHFSDTLLFWSQSVDGSDLQLENEISMHFYCFLCNLVSSALFEQIPLRGAIAFGPMHADSLAGVVVGQPVIDAYRLEQAQEWIGVALDTSCSARPQHKEAGFFLVRYPPPLKSGSSLTSTAVLDWTGPLRVSPQNFERIRGFNPRNRFQSVMAVGREGDMSVHQKYLNTESFVLEMQRLRPIHDSLGFF